MALDRVKLLNWVKSKTDSGLLFRFRSWVIWKILLILNFDIYLKSFFNFRSKPVSKTKKIGILSMYRPIFWHGNIFEMQINQTLKKEGAQSVHILCKGILDVCDSLYLNSNKKNNPNICKDCVTRNRLFYTQNQGETLWLDDYVDSKEIQTALSEVDKLSDINNAIDFKYKTLPLGKMVRLSVCRYFLRLGLSNEHLPVFKQFLKASIKLHNAFIHLLEKENFDRFLIFNGRYATYNIPLYLIQQKGLPYATYELSEQERFFFSTNQIAVLWHDVKEKFEQWLKASPTVTNLSTQVSQFVEQRRKRFVSSYVDLDQTIQITEPVDIAIFTNVVWDSAAFDRDTIFEGQFEWVRELIEWAGKTPELNIVIRIHPAETNVTYNKSDERMFHFIQTRFPTLPSNVRVIPPEERKNSYGLLEQAKVVAVYSSSIGLEAALSKKPVFMAGWTHFIQSGITHSPNSKEDFFKLLLDAVKNPKAFEPDLDLVHKYTYWYYKVYHRLNNTHLHKKPFVLMEDSRFIRVPKIKPVKSQELEALSMEFLHAPATKEPLNRDL